MVSLDYIHVCDYAFLGEGGKPCIIGIFDGINAHAFPATHPQMALTMRLRGKAHELIPVRIQLAQPNGNVLAQMDGQITAGPDGAGALNLNLVTLQFPEPGRYAFKVLSGTETLASHSFRVNKTTAPTPAPPPLRH